MLKVPGWEMSIVWYFFLGGIAGGAYFTAAIADNFGSFRDRAVARVGYLLSLPLAAAAARIWAESAAMIADDEDFNRIVELQLGHTGRSEPS